MADCREELRRIDATLQAIEKILGALLISFEAQRTGLKYDREAVLELAVGTRKEAGDGERISGDS